MDSTECRAELCKKGSFRQEIRGWHWLFISFFSRFAICLLFDNSSVWWCQMQRVAKFCFSLRFLDDAVKSELLLWCHHFWQYSHHWLFLMERFMNWSCLSRQSCDGSSGMRNYSVQIPLDCWTPKLHPFKTYMTLIPDFAGFCLLSLEGNASIIITTSNS